MQRYSVGFAFSRTDTPASPRKCVLIHKTHPSNQAGKVNGVGGKVEVFETPAQGMSREYLEETGVITDPFDWEEFAKLSGDDWAVHCFRIFDDEAVESAKTMTEEEIFVDTLDAATYLKFFENASWLFYMALDVDLDRNVVDVTWD